MTSTPLTTRARQAFDDLFDRPADLRFLGAVRRAFGVVVVVHLLDFLGPALDGRIYRDRFHVPWWDWVPHPPRAAYHLLLAVGLTAGAAMALAVRSRAATVVALVCVTWNLALDQTAFHHNRAFLVLVLAGLALLPAGGRADSSARHTTAWPLWLLRFVAASVYFTSGITKAVDADWRGGVVTHDRVVRHADELAGLPFDGVLTDVLTSTDVHTVVAPCILATELFIALGLWFGPTRLAAVWTAITFHLAIEVGASVQVFSLAGIAALGIWTSLDGATRCLTAPPGSGWAAAVRRLDWLVRFEHRTGTGLVLTTPDGRDHHGLDARLRILTALPVTFWFAAPVLAASRLLGRSPTDRPAPTPTR